jgi:hypothetical protein
MKSLYLLALLLPAAAGDVWAADLTHLRMLDAWAAESIERGLSRSTTVRDLVVELGRSNLIVHVETTRDLRGTTAGTTQLIYSGSGYRYVRIVLDRSLPPDARAAILGHELQHAVEIARSGAQDEAGIRRLFETIGHSVSGMRNVFETKAAAMTTVRVWSELHGDSKRGPER